MNSHKSYVPNELDRRLEQFDQCWHRGDVPLIEDFLTATDSRALDESGRRQLLVELVLIDLEYRWQQSGDDDKVTCDSTNQPQERATLPARPLLEDYVRRYPELGPLDELPSTLIADEYRVRWLWGDKPSMDQYLQRFGQQAERIRGTLRGVKQELHGKESSSGVHIRCPHCHGPVDLADSNLSDVSCPSCGSHFSLLGSEAHEDLAHAKKRLGHFELLQQIGTGSFGTVWKARDCELDRMVAVKIPRRGQLAPSEVEQFLREARAVAQLRHPNIVSVHQVGREENTIYIASDYVEGCTLEKLIDDHRLTTGETAKLCAKIADALHHAHEAGVVHRDLKPSNIIIDTRGQPHIMDFGLARREAGEITMTVDGKVLGTPAYMSPEQAKGEAHQADGRSDIYSVGVILFELLTGETPFRGNIRMLLHHVIHDEAPSPRRFDSGIHRDLETICLKCLEKDERNRYGTCQALADELRHYLRGEPIHARPISPVARVWRWCKRNPLVAGLGTTAAGLLLLLAVAGPLVALRQTSLARREAASAERNRRLLYAAEMIEAQQAWGTANLQRVLELLRRQRPGPGQEDLRGFVWDYLWEHCRRGMETPTIGQHDSMIWAVAFSPDGQVLASGGNDFYVKLWDVVGGRHLATLPKPESGSGSLAFSPDGKILASAGTLGPAELWDMAQLQRIATLRPKSHPWSVTFHPEGQTLATGNFDGTVTLWDVKTRQEIETLQRHSDRVTSVAFSPDGTILASSGERTVRLLNLSTGTDRMLEGHGSWVRHMTISPDGKTVASASHDKEVRLWDVETGAFKILSGHVGPLFCVSFSHDSKTLASAGTDGTVKLWDVSTAQETDNLTGHKSYILAVAFSPKRQTLATGGEDGQVKLWDVSTRTPRDVLQGHSQSISSVVFSTDGKTVVSGSHDGTIAQWDVATGTRLRSIPAHRSWVTAVAISADGKVLATGSDDGTPKLWGADTLAEMPTSLEAGNLAVWGVSFSPDGKTLASAGTGTNVKLWDVHTGQLKREFDVSGLFPLVQTVAVSGDGKFLAIGGYGKNVGLVDLGGDGSPKKLVGHTSNTLTLAFGLHSTENILASGSGNGTVKLWDVKTGKELRTLSGHSREIRSVTFSPNGQILATGSRDSTIKLWYLEKDREPETLIGHASAVSSVAFSPDGRTLASGGEDNTVRLWRTAGRGAARDAVHP